MLHQIRAVERFIQNDDMDRVRKKAHRFEAKALRFFTFVAFVIEINERSFR